MKISMFIFVFSLLGFSTIPVLAEQRKIMDPVSGCAVFTLWTDVSDMSWSGGCSNGIAKGEGIINWFRDGKLVWRSLIGSSHALRLEDGKMIMNLSPEDFIITCKGKDNSSYRGVKMHPKEVLRKNYFYSSNVARTVLSWGAEYAYENCPNKAKNWGNIAVNLFTDPTDDIRGALDHAPVRGRNFPDDHIDWFAPRSEYNNTYQYRFSQSIKDEERERKRLKAQEKKTQRAAQIKNNFDAAIQRVNQKVNKFLNTGLTNLEVLSTAILSRQLDTLALMDDRSITIQGLISSEARTVKYDDVTYYAVDYKVKSLREQVIDDFQKNQSFSWSNFADQTQNVGRGYVEIICLFSSVQKVPRVAADVSASLKSFDGDSELVFFCE